MAERTEGDGLENGLSELISCANAPLAPPRSGSRTGAYFGAAHASPQSVEHTFELYYPAPEMKGGQEGLLRGNALPRRVRRRILASWFGATAEATPSLGVLHLTSLLGGLAGTRLAYSKRIIR